MKQPEGKYVLVKDPNKVRIQLYRSYLSIICVIRITCHIHCDRGHAGRHIRHRAYFSHAAAFPYRDYSMLASVSLQLYFTDIHQQPVIRLYSVPLSAFTAEDEEEIVSDGEDAEV